MKKHKKKHKNHKQHGQEGHAEAEQVSGIETGTVAADLSSEAPLVEVENEIESSGEGEENENKGQKKENPIKVALIRNKSRISIAAFLFLVLGSYVYSYGKTAAAKNESLIKEQAEKYIKENLVKPGTDLKIAEIKKEGSLYKLTVSVDGQEVPTYVTEDGGSLLLNAIDMRQKKDETGAVPATAKPAAEASVKKDVPEVELFVMSLCPYGVQAEKGILPVIQKLGSKINFSVKFVDYTLHGKKEFDENLNQYCIQKEEPTKFNDYLTCFAKEGDSAKCVETAKVSASKVASCVAETDKQFKLTENFSATGQSSPFGIHKDLNKKYGVQGSPSLVVNGQLVDAGRDSASLLKTICSGFNNQPEECKAALSATSPTPGFGS